MLEDVVDFVRADFAASGCPAKVFLGKEFLNENAAPGRVVFLESAAPDSFQMPLAIQSTGSMPQTVDDWQRLGGANPRAIRRRVVTSEVHIWARAKEQSDPSLQDTADRAYLNALINQTVLSLHRAAPGNNQFVNGRKKQEPVHMHSGLVYILNISVEIPVVDLPNFTDVLDCCSRSWQLKPADIIDVTVDLTRADETLIESVTFFVGEA